MRVILYLICLLSGVTSFAFAESRYNNSTIALRDIASSLEAYRKANEGKYPGTWQELISSGHMGEIYLDSGRRYLDFENRYGLTDSLRISFDGIVLKIVAISKQPGDEGNDLKALNPEDIQGRRLIAEDQNGELHYYRYSERQIKQSFEQGGLRLADYTSNAPPQPDPKRYPKKNFKTVNATPVESGHPSPAGDPVEPESRSGEVRQDLKPMVAGEAPTDFHTARSLGVIAIFVLIIAGGGYFLKRRFS